MHTRENFEGTYRRMVREVFQLPVSS
jgi:hypothetical protein